MESTPIPLLSALFAHSAEGILTYDHDLRFTSWNPRMEQLTGISSANAVGKIAFEVLHFLEDVGGMAVMSRTLQGETALVPARPFLISESGRSGYFEARHFPLRADSGEVIGAVALIRLIEKTGEQGLPPETMRLLQLQSMVRALAVAMTPTEVGEAILRECMRTFVSSRSVITRIPPSGDDAEVLVAGEPIEKAPAKWCTFPLSRPMPTSVAIKTKKSVFHCTRSELLETYPEARGWVLSNDLHAFAAVPMIIENRVVAALGLGFTHERAFPQDERDFLFTLAGPCAQAFERSHAFEREKQARETAEAANQAKGQFIANLSHEIRTPLCSLINFAEFLTEPNLEETKRTRFIEGARRNGRTLVRLIDDILDLSRIESGRVLIKRERVSLPLVLEEIETMFQESVEQKGLQLTAKVDESAPQHICSDPTRIRQILVNLVGNAVKFTAKGRISVVARRKEQSGGKAPDLLEFTITDTGIGLRPEDQSRIFEPFFQVDSSFTREYSGAGLGLALSQRLARALDGEVRLESSQPGVGTTFVFSLALTGEAAAQTIESNQKLDSAPAIHEAVTRRSLRVLVVEDQPDIQEIVTRILEESGIETLVAVNGLAAVALCNDNEFDLVLMDLQMPVMDGFAALKSIRAQKKSVPPIVAMTAHALPEDANRIRLAGFDGHLTKPLERGKLMQAIIQHCSKAR